MKRAVLLLLLAFAILATRGQNDRSEAIRIAIIGDEYLKEGYFPEAIDYYREALAIYPEYVKATFQIAQCYRLSDQADSAAFHYESIISDGQDHRYPMTRYHLAMIQLDENQVKEAKENLTTFRKLLLENKLSTLKKYVDFYEQAQEELDKM